MIIRSRYSYKVQEKKNKNENEIKKISDKPMQKQCINIEPSTYFLTKSKVSFLSSISSSDSKSKILLISWASPLSKAVITHPGLTVISSPAITTSKTIKS